MAEKALKKLEEQLNCSICHGTYTDPKLLQCSHVYCHKCLVKLVVQDQHGQLSLNCLTCSQGTPIPPNGVAGLQPAFYISHLLEIQDSFKEIHTLSSTTNEAVSCTMDFTPAKRVKVGTCTAHINNEVELYCETCGEFVCLKCALKGGEHHNHDCELLGDAFEWYKKEITSSLEPVEEQLETIKRLLVELDTCCKEVASQEVTIEANIRDTIRRLHEVLDVRKADLLGQLHEITKDKLNDLAAQKEQVETALAQLNCCLDFMGESLGTENQGMVSMMKTTVVKQINTLTATFQPDVLKPNTEADIMFSTSADITAICQNYGKVYSASTQLSPSQCHIMDEGLQEAVVGEKSTTILQAVDYNRQPYVKSIKSLECELVSELTGVKAMGSIAKRGQSQYEISYQPTVKGRNQLHVKAKKQHVKGSPFTIAVKRPLEQLGTPVLTLEGVKKPWGIAIKQNKELVVTSYGENCVSVFSARGEKLQSFGTPGSGQGQFKNPRGVAVDGEGNILVADCDNHRIQKFTAEGQFLSAVGTLGNGKLQFKTPINIAFNASNSKLYVVERNERVQVLNSDLTFSAFFGYTQFRNPCGITCDSTGNILVAEYDNHRIQVFTAQGTLLRTFGRQGAGKGDLNCPAGIAIDASGMVYVSEGSNYRISLFTSDGQFVRLFGKNGVGPGEFNQPRDLLVDESGVVYVCDCDNNCVQVL